MLGRRGSGPVAAGAVILAASGTGTVSVSVGGNDERKLGFGALEARACASSTTIARVHVCACWFAIEDFTAVGDAL